MCMSRRRGLPALRVAQDNEDEWIEAGRGLVVYLSFKDGATDAAVAKLVKTLLTVRLIPSGDSGRPASAVECATQAEGAWAPDLLVVPQACLSGKAKGKQVQYHGQLAKDEGARMYAAFVELLQSQAAALVAGSGGGGKAKARGADGDDESKGGEGEVPAVTVPRVLAGTYGNRQGLELKTDGPMTHFFEF